MKNPELVERAYSMASYPAEGKQVMLMSGLLHLLLTEIKMDGWMLILELLPPIYLLKNLEIK